ncbi:unnamed protein product, partial [Rotaria sordida]
MSSSADSDTNVTSTTDEKHHILLVYIVKENGEYEGAYVGHNLELIGEAAGSSFQAMIDNAYWSLETLLVEAENNAP